MQTLPKELKTLVKDVINLLGIEIKNVYGEEIYSCVENLRVEIKNSKSLTPAKKLNQYVKELSTLERFSKEQQLEITHSFGIYLELINRVETAYRHFRLAGKKEEKTKESPYAIIYVFTAHPTEARSPKIMELFNKIENILIAHLMNLKDDFDSDVSYLLNLILRSSLSSKNKPTVLDEATHIYNIVLDEDILSLQIEMLKNGVTVHFRSWVGGDKDGHPFVNHDTMKDSLQLSRDRLLSYVLKEFNLHLSNLKQIDSPLHGLTTASKEIIKLLDSVKEIKRNDGVRIHKIKELFELYYLDYTRKLKHVSPHLQAIKNLIWLYPTLVLPLEIREDSELVHQAIKKPAMEISKMLKYLQEISIGESSKWYVRGFVLSMCESADDYLAGIKLVQKTLKDLYIPVVPLFETRKALANATQILDEVFKRDKSIILHHKDFWDSRFEIMLGYSDSSKENGVFTGKWLIAKAINQIDLYLLSKKLTPVFFHGSGGSVARGGGSLKEQIQWWPQSALNIYKVTIQGEMVPRHFGDKLILKSQINKISKELSKVKVKKSNEKFINVMDEIGDLSKEKYKNLFDDKLFLKMIKVATPYQYLDELKIGSRPTKRNNSKSEELKLRAIPWILCWTQTRALLPNWYGIGSAWSKLSRAKKDIIISNYKTNDYLKSYINVLGFSLAKVELAIFSLYLNEFLSKQEASAILKLVGDEFKLSIKFFNEVSGQQKLLFFKPWLAESIELRSRMIHPLNMLQIIALKNHRYHLLRETVTAIACGMMTTG